MTSLVIQKLLMYSGTFIRD